MNFDPEFLIKFPKLCLAEVLRDVQFWPDSCAKKSIWYMHGFTYQNYYPRQKYHFILALTENLAWVNETANCESVLKTRRSR